jgi:hypothetical protein
VINKQSIYNSLLSICFPAVFFPIFFPPFFFPPRFFSSRSVFFSARAVFFFKRSTRAGQHEQSARTMAARGARTPVSDAPASEARPSSLRIQAGAYVVMCGLIATQYNGKFGIAVSERGDGRWEVQLLNGDKRWFKPQNMNPMVELSAGLQDSVDIAFQSMQAYLTWLEEELRKTDEFIQETRGDFKDTSMFSGVDTCAVCGKPGIKLAICTKCKRTGFCSDECKKIKHECDLNVCVVDFAHKVTVVATQPCAQDNGGQIMQMGLQAFEQYTSARVHKTDHGVDNECREKGRAACKLSQEEALAWLALDDPDLFGGFKAWKNAGTCAIEVVDCRNALYYFEKANEIADQIPQEQHTVEFVSALQMLELFILIARRRIKYFFTRWHLTDYMNSTNAIEAGEAGAQA